MNFDAFKDLLTDWSQDNPPDPPVIRPIFADSLTGNRAVATTPACLYWWAEGSGGCDCNREHLFPDDEEDDVADEDDGRHCLGSERFVAVDLAGEHASHPAKDDILAYINEAYPADVIAKARNAIVPNRERTS